MKEQLEDISLAEEAYAILRSRILHGELSIGQAMSRRKIAAEFGMSMLPVAEALLRLEIEGLLESRPRAGTRVRIPSEQDVRGHYVVREALEVAAARLFAEVATLRERTGLQKLAARVDLLYARNQANQNNRLLFLNTHEKFHRRIAECTRCKPLVEAIEKNHVLSSTWLCVPRAILLKEDVMRHQQLAEALTNSDPNTAAAAMTSHVHEALNNTLQRLATHFQLYDSQQKSFSRSAKKTTPVTKTQNENLLAVR